MLKTSTARRRRGLTLWIVLAMGVTFVGGGVVLYEEVIEEYYLTTRWGTVEDGQVYRSGNLPPVRVEQLLADHGIRVICKLTGDVEGVWHHQREREAAEKLGIDLRIIPMPGDGTGNVQDYIEAVTLIHDAVQAGKPVLVRCSAGTNRTGGVIASYRMLVQGQDPQTAYREMLRYNFSTADNPALLPHLNERLPAIAAGLVQRGVIDRVPDPIPRLGP